MEKAGWRNLAGLFFCYDTAMRALTSARYLAALASVGLVAACSDSGPTTPTRPSVADQVAPGAYVLRITSACSAPGDPRIFAFVHSRVNLSRSGSDWIATASSPAAGDVELRLRESAGVPGFSLQLSGSIRGTAIHMPELATVPLPDVRVNFGGDGRTGLSGVGFGVTSITPVAGMDGIGAGTITISDGAGQSCTTSGFSWWMARV
jgi:hypothetical protein